MFPTLLPTLQPSLPVILPDAPTTSSFSSTSTSTTTTTSTTTKDKDEDKDEDEVSTKPSKKSSGKKTGRPFSALDLSSVRLKGTIGTKAVAPPPAGAGPTPLHEQLKRALQSKFFKVRATPSAAVNAAPEQDDVDEWQ
jgi:hypothetical protein